MRAVTRAVMSTAARGARSRNSLAERDATRQAARRSDDVAKGVTMLLMRSISNPAVVAGRTSLGPLTVAG